MIDVPLVVEPPDVLLIEVLEALPGRPITGERLVRPDGTISLGFYGDVHVRGLTLPAWALGEATFERPVARIDRLRRQALHSAQTRRNFQRLRAPSRHFQPAPGR